MDKPFVEREKELLQMNKAINNKCKELCVTTKTSMNTPKTKPNAPKKLRHIQQERHHCPIATKIEKKPTIESYIGTRLALVENIEELTENPDLNEKLTNDSVKREKQNVSVMDKQKTVATTLFNNEYPQVIGKKSVSAEGLIK